MLDRLSAPRLVIGGVVLSCAGIASYFQLERHSLECTTDVQFLILEKVFFPTTILGLMIVLGASLTLAWRAAAGRLFAWGIGLLVLGSLAFAVVPINVHRWTGMLLLPLFTALLIGALFVAGGTLRLVVNRVRVPKPDLNCASVKRADPPHNEGMHPTAQKPGGG